jgi:hypothetical protein
MKHLAEDQETAYLGSRISCMSSAVLQIIMSNAVHFKEVLYRIKTFAQGVYWPAKLRELEKVMIHSMRFEAPYLSSFFHFLFISPSDSHKKMS